jgi:exodeoxyribonuclease VIII
MTAEPLPLLTNDEYHAHPAVSKSHLDQVAKSPAHYWARYLDPDRVQPEPTAAMVLGTALHTAVLEPHLWEQQFAIAPEGIDRRTKAGKDAWASFEADAQGKTVLTGDDGQRIRRMAAAVHQHPASSFLLELPGTREASYLWADDDTGLECKCRPDWHSADRRILVDVKTTKDASPREFARSVAAFRYHVQANWYQRPFPEAEQFLFIAVESQPPHLVAVYAATPAMVAAGGRAADQNLRQIAACRLTGVWPGYSDEIQPIDLPTWCHD